jgi:PPP family 3-phenylpropionic acid transporter
VPGERSRLALSARYALVSAGTFVTIGIYLPFWPLWLEGRGLTPSEIGLLLGISVWVRVPSGPLIGQLADLGGSPKYALVTAAASCLFVFALFFLPGGFWQLLVLQVLAAAALSALMPLCESLTMQAVRRHDLIYGRIRIWGSLAFITAAFGGGALIAPEEAGIVLWLLLAAFSFATLASLAVPNEGKRSGPRRLQTRWLDLLGRKRLLLFLVAGAVLQASHALFYGFSSLYWTSSGLTPTAVGALWALGTGAEIVLFWMSAPLVRRCAPALLLLGAGACGLLRWTLFAVTTDFALLAMGQLLHAGTFGLTHLAAMNMITDSAPPDRVASVQTFYSGVLGGLAMGAMMLLSGDLYEWAGGQAFFAMAMVSATGAALALPLLASRER